MDVNNLIQADDLTGCPFPFFGDPVKPPKKVYKIYNDGGHFIATIATSPQQSFARLVRKLNNGEYKKGYEKAKKTNGRSALDILFDSLYLQAYKQGLKDSNIDKPMTDFIRAGILKLYPELSCKICSPKMRYVTNNKGLLLSAKQINSQIKRINAENNKTVFDLDEYIADKIKRKYNNLLHRKKRFRRKANLNRWNYFVTFTYNDAKHTAETFKKKLRKCLSNLHTRRGWKYMGVFEEAPETGRLHFHGLIYVPAGEMLGTLTEKQDYSTAQGKIQTRNENDFFADSFGRNDFCEVSTSEMKNGKRTEYILKYIGKTNERICYSRGIPTEIYKVVDGDDIITEMKDFVTKYILFDDIIDWERDIMRYRYNKQMSIIDLLCNPPLSA